MEVNSELLERIADHIEAEPEHFDMQFWEAEFGCGTVCCIAGWAVRLGLGQSIYGDNRNGGDQCGRPDVEAARLVLGLPGSALFSVGTWPVSYRVAFDNARYGTRYGDHDHRHLQEEAMIAAQLCRDVAKKGYEDVYDATWNADALDEGATCLD